jgi:lipocalin
MSERAYGRLLDKCEKLEADNERLQTRYNSATDQAVRYADDCARLTAEVTSKSEQIGKLYRVCNERDELRNDNERLRAALKPFAHEYDVLMQQQDGFPAWHSVRTKHLMEAARALEPKP